MKPSIIKARKQAKLREKRNSYKFLHKKAWALFSLHIRLKYADCDGMVRCFCCGALKHYKQMHASHFFHGRLDFSEDNIYPTCPQCNTFRSGNLAIYAERLVAMGVDLVKLRREAETIKYSCSDLKKLIEKYK